MERNQKSSPEMDQPSAAGSCAAVDQLFMSRALELAWRAAGLTNPNPLVGGVIVKDGVVVGEGYHHRCGEAHAEVEALQQAGELSRGATLYVSLEPCAHHGRTPPCVERLIAAGLRRVVIPTIDPDEHVSGRGVELLRAAGVRVDIGCAATAAIATNVGYYKQRLGLGPTVVLKMALTMDGKISSGPGRRDKITGEAAQLYVHRLRANSDAILVGVDTVLTDDPILDCRLTDCGAAPVPVVLDGKFALPADNRWSREGRPYVILESDRTVNGDAAASEHEARGGRVLRHASDGGGRIDVKEAVLQLSGAGLNRLLVEGGAQVFTSFVREGVWDAIILFHSSKAFGERGVAVYADTNPMTPDAVSVDAVRLDDDFLIRYLNRRVLDDISARLSDA